MTLSCGIVPSGAGATAMSERDEVSMASRKKRRRVGAADVQRQGLSGFPLCAWGSPGKLPVHSPPVTDPARPRNRSHHPASCSSLSRAALCCALCESSRREPASTDDRYPVTDTVSSLTPKSLACATPPCFAPFFAHRITSASGATLYPPTRSLCLSMHPCELFLLGRVARWAYWPGCRLDLCDRRRRRENAH